MLVEEKDSIYQFDTTTMHFCGDHSSFKKWTWGEKLIFENLMIESPGSVSILEHERIFATQEKDFLNVELFFSSDSALLFQYCQLKSYLNSHLSSYSLTGFHQTDENKRMNAKGVGWTTYQNGKEIMVLLYIEVFELPSVSDLELRSFNLNSNAKLVLQILKYN